MPGLGFKVIPKNFTFDRQKVRDAYDRGKSAAFSLIGAYVRYQMRALLSRRSTSSAAPGQSPSRHEGGLYDKVFYSFNADGVDIGPVPYRGGEAPELNEFGGETTRTRGRGGRSYRAHYRPHPFAGPSLQKEIEAGTISPAWAGVVKN